MTYIPEEVIDEIVDVIINTRDFCGNEREAVLDHLQEEGIRGADAIRAYRIANFRANMIWDRIRKEAGVKPKHLMG